MTTRLRIGLSAAALLTALAATSFAGEDVTEHETYEKRSMKVETVPAMPTTTTAPGRVYERREESTTVERRSDAPPPPPVVRERETETIEKR